MYFLSLSYEWSAMIINCKAFKYHVPVTKEGLGIVTELVMHRYPGGLPRYIGVKNAA
jgi:hypothetical protein